MNQRRLMQVLLAPQISEKATYLSEKRGQLVIRVVRDANKEEIKAAVESLFKVEVRSVQVLNVKGKTKRFRQVPGVRRGWKKAFVCLKPGQDISLVENGVV